MNFTQEELQELQKINSISDHEFGTRIATPQEIQIFNTTVEELFEQGFAVTKDNFLKLWLAFDSNPHVPITKPNILETVKVYRDRYQWKSQEEIDYGKLSQQLGEQKTTAIWNYLGGHYLKKTFSNWLTCARCIQSQGWGTESRESFTRLINQIQWSPASRYGELEWAPNPDERQRQKESEARANTPMRQVTEEEREAAISHISQGFEKGRFKKYTPTSHPAPRDEGQTASERANIYWNGRIASLVASIESNNLRSEVEQFSNRISMPDIEKKFYAVEAYLNRRKTERAMAGRMG